MKIEEFQKLGKNVKVIIRKFTENPGKFASVVLQMYWDIKKERDLYKQQRDELIKDIVKLRERNATLEKKAQAFDEIVNAVDESANSYELVARIKLEVLKYQKLEREER
nr:MAG TPA: Protein of unknown function (DUF1024) [Caudoviricetes sp.]